MVSTIEQTAFPKIGDEQQSKIKAIADRVVVAAGEKLITQSQKDYPFYIVESGEVRIVEEVGGVARHIATHGPGAFTGDIDMLTGRAAIISAIACGEVVAYRLCAARMRRLLNECPDVSEMLLDAFQMRRQMLEGSEFVGVKMVGEPNTLETSRLREFFYKNRVPHTFYEMPGDDANHEIAELGASDLDLPVVHCNGHTVGNPSLPKLAECIGIARNVDQRLFDLVIVGAGPAGLAAAVYASSERISTLVIDSVGPGGQAGSSSRIENFIGFPSGLSGNELANRGYLQALKFGTEFIAPITVKSIEQCPDGQHHLKLCTGQTARAPVRPGGQWCHLSAARCTRLQTSRRSRRLLRGYFCRSARL